MESELQDVRQAAADMRGTDLGEKADMNAAIAGNEARSKANKEWVDRFVGNATKYDRDATLREFASNMRNHFDAVDFKGETARVPDSEEAEAVIDNQHMYSFGQLFDIITIVSEKGAVE